MENWKHARKRDEKGGGQHHAAQRGARAGERGVGGLSAAALDALPVALGIEPASEDDFFAAIAEIRRAVRYFRKPFHVSAVEYIEKGQRELVESLKERGKLRPGNVGAWQQADALAFATALYGAVAESFYEQPARRVFLKHGRERVGQTYVWLPPFVPAELPWPAAWLAWYWPELRRRYVDALLPGFEASRNERRKAQQSGWRRVELPNSNRGVNEDDRTVLPMDELVVETLEPRELVAERVLALLHPNERAWLEARQSRNATELAGAAGRKRDERLRRRIEGLTNSLQIMMSQTGPEQALVDERKESEVETAELVADVARDIEEAQRALAGAAECARKLAERFPHDERVQEAVEAFLADALGN
ncbi:MAG: hypothetical protein M3N29_00845 [Chloroflexota bacterium]|nr:hypothetical protein [Chloroflexota bacterium]